MKMKRFTLRMLLLLLCLLFMIKVSAAASVNITVESTITVNSFKPRMLGTNVAIFANDGYYPSANPKIINIIKGAGIKLLRYPGGDEADMAGFNRGENGRWDLGNPPYNRTIYAGHLDAFIELCRKTGAQPIITVNGKIDNPQMAADIVRHCNVDKKYNIKYFEIGNEPDLWGDVTPEQYAERLSRYTAAMKAVDSSIKIVGPAVSQAAKADVWTKPVLQQQGAKIDAVTEHWYPLVEGTVSTHPASPSIDNLLYWDRGEGANIWHQNASIVYANRFVKSNQDSLVNLRNQYSPNAEIGLTEIAPVTGGGGYGVSEVFGAALWYGDILGRLAYNGIDFVAHFMLQGDQRYTFVSRDLSSLRPNWYAYVMYNRYFGDTMLFSSSDHEADLTVWASKNSGINNKLYIMIINKHQTEEKTANINLGSFIPQPEALKWVLNSSSAEAVNANINGVSADSDFVLPEISGDTVSGVSSNFTYTFPAHSITCFEFTKKIEGIALETLEFKKGFSWLTIENITDTGISPGFVRGKVVVKNITEEPKDVLVRMDLYKKAIGSDILLNSTSVYRTIKGKRNAESGGTFSIPYANVNEHFIKVSVWDSKECDGEYIPAKIFDMTGIH